MIEAVNITKNYGALKAVDQLSFELKAGEVVGFLGPNGAGKTTTLRILTGYLPATSGTCRISGIDISDHSFEARKKIGYLPESTPLYGDMEVTDYLTYLGSIRQLSRVQIQEGLREVVRTCGLSKVVGRKISTLSKGYRQRVGLAQALLHRPEVLVLDEPTVGLDPNQIAEIRGLIQEIGRERTVILSTHILSEVEQTCQRVIIISSGKIVGEGSPQDLMTRNQALSVYQVGFRADLAALQEALARLPGFEKAIVRKSQANVHYLDLYLAGQNDLSEELFKLAVANRYPLLELKREEATLEDVFKQLTR